VTPILAFPTYLIRGEWADRVVSPMHDVLTQDERTALMAANPYTYLHVARQPGDDGPDVDPGEQAAAALDRLLASGAFNHLETPALYLYRLRTPDHQQTGVVAEVPVEAFTDGAVRGHEEVQADRVAALVKHHEAVAGRSALVALMYRADPGVGQVVDLLCKEEPLVSISAGLDQEVWAVDDPELTLVIAAAVGRQRLYVTDGHHRVAAAIEEWRRAGHPSDRRVLCVLFPDDQLRTLAFHRRVVGPVEPEQTKDRLVQDFRWEQASGPTRRPGSFGVYLGGEWGLLVPRRLHRRPGVEGLDVSFLHREVLDPIFEIEGVGDPKLEVVSELGGTHELARRCDHDGGILFLLCPPSIDQIMEVSDRGQVMAAKSTYFDPKPGAGLFLRFAGA
jgi:uncharacterized protein (DUF1015 family)